MRAKAEPAPDWQSTSLSRTNLDKLLRERAELKEQEKELKANLEVLDLRIRGLFEKHKVDKARVGRYQASLFEMHTAKRLDPTKLLELGVRQSVLNKAMTGGKVVKAFRITDLGEEYDG